MADELEGQEIELGGVKLRVVEQPYPRLVRDLAAAIVAVLDAGEDLDESSLLRAVGDNLYDVLAAAIPDLEEKLPRDRFESPDTGPSVPALKRAFKAIIEVNDLADIAPKGFGDVLETVAKELANLISPSSPSGNGGSPASTTSGTKARTGTGRKGSRSGGSSGSSKRTNSSRQKKRAGAR